MNRKVMVDSGAHSLYHKNVFHGQHDYSFYETQEFWDYVDKYAEHIKQNLHLIETFVSVDVIYNPELSWKVLKYLEDTHKLHPLPVFHPGEDLSWLKKYVDNYDYIGIGGLGQTSKKARWMNVVGDHAWRVICDPKTRLPRVKVHGFAMTSPDLIIRYPYYSVDSTSWVQFGKFGLIIVPRKINGKFVYEESPHIFIVSQRKVQKSRAEHFVNLSKAEQKHVHEYLEMKGFKMGKSILVEQDFDKTKPVFPLSDKELSSEEKIIEVGVCNNGGMRDALNLEYYLDLEAAIPPWPRPWKRTKRTMTSLPI